MGPSPPLFAAALMRTDHAHICLSRCTSRAARGVCMWITSSVASLTPALCGVAQGSKPDYLYLLQRMCMDNPEAAVGLAKSVARQPGPPIELNTLADVFLQRNMVREATAFLLDVLQGDDPAHDKLQTKARARARLVAAWVWGTAFLFVLAAGRRPRT